MCVQNQPAAVLTRRIFNCNLLRAWFPSALSHSDHYKSLGCYPVKIRETLMCDADWQSQRFERSNYREGLDCEHVGTDVGTAVVRMAGRKICVSLPETWLFTSSSYNVTTAVVAGICNAFLFLHGTIMLAKKM
jgi:hypothetical protein